MNGNGPMPMAMAARFSRHFYPAASIDYGPLEKLCPGLQIQMDAGAEPFALVFTLPDGEQHAFLFDENGRRNLMRTLSGGIEIARDLKEVGA